MKRSFSITSATALVAAAAMGLATASGMAASKQTRSTDTQPPTPPHLFAVRGLGGCEIDLAIGLSTDNVTPQASIRYEVLSDGRHVPFNIVFADTRGSQPGDGNLNAYGRSSGGTQSFTVRAIDQAGNFSAPSNAVSRRVGTCS